MPDQPPTTARSREKEEWQQGIRFLPILLFAFVVVLLLIGGVAAVLYLLFSQYSGIRNLWILICCVPSVVLILAIITVYSLYTRFGKPMGQIFSAIDSVSEGNLGVRVPEDNSPQFGQLIKRFNKMVVKLERADQQRRDLTADIAHELRTPLHIIQGNLEGILDGVYDATPKHINDALEETKLLAHLVDDLQTLSLAEMGQLPLHKTRFLLADLIYDVTRSFSAQAASLGIDLKANITDANQQITADFLRLNQVLSNLVTNALRYTPKGGTISLETESGAGQEGNVRIRVKDTGVGISPEDLPFIFDRFWRGEKSRSRDGHATSGLGLAISRQLIYAHGGTIEAQSEVGKGTNFVIELPEQSS
jgi:two-component system OmpR family sensor kinase/two-component system sensor histidine kinase BaeS